MTLSEIFGVLGTVAGIIIGASGKYITGLLNKKRDETIVDFELKIIKEKITELRKDVDIVAGKADRIPVIEQRLKTLEHDQNKH